MRRRELIMVLGGAVICPLEAHAQQPNRMRRIGFLHALAEHDPEAQSRISAFREALEEFGWQEKRNVLFEHYFGGGDVARIRAHAVALAGAAPDVIVANGSPVIAALKQATSTIPIVFNVVNDPVGQGFVASLARPGGNITGFSYIDFPMIGKWFEIFKEAVPSVRRTMLLFNPDAATYYAAFMRDFKATAPPLSIELVETPVRSVAEIEAAVAMFAQTPDGGLIAFSDAFINTHHPLVVALALRHRLPTLLGFRQHVRAGGLMSYGPDSLDIVRRSASYVDRILKGENPANLPIQAPTKFQLVINLKTAKALGLTLPPTFLFRADEVIE